MYRNHARPSHQRTCAAGRLQVEQALAFGASRREAGGAIVKAGVRAALECLVALVGGPGLLLLPALAAGLVLSGLPPMQVVICHPSASLQSAQACKSCTLVSNTHAHGQSVHSSDMCK